MINCNTLLAHSVGRVLLGKFESEAGVDLLRRDLPCSELEARRGLQDDDLLVLPHGLNIINSIFHFRSRLSN